MKSCSAEGNCPQSVEGEGIGEAATRLDGKEGFASVAVIHSRKLLNLFFGGLLINIMVHQGSRMSLSEQRRARGGPALSHYHLCAVEVDGGPA